jgi:serine/threonine-protein kinase
LVTENAEAPRGLVAGKYRLSRLLGRGGMGSVWEAVHVTLGNRVAVKFIDVEHVDSPEARSRFENEARAAAKLRSKYVVEVYDHGVSDDGRPFIVMEYLDGEPLDRRLDRVGRLTGRETALILQQVCRALSKAHAAGIVHRDLKPENVFLVWDDEDGADVAKVVDFGIAKFTDASLSPSSATRTGSVLGTPYYMSPEQARGLRSVDSRADIWSLGVIAYRCIVGGLPFEGEGVGDLLVKLCTADIPVPSAIFPGVPPGFDSFVQRALERDPERRFQSVRDFSDSLGAICGLSGRGAYVTGETPQVSGWGSADASGPNGVVQVAEVATVRELPAVVTGAPLTQTPAPRSVKPPRRSSTRLLGGLAAVVALVLALGIAVKKFGSGQSALAVAAATSARLDPLVSAAAVPVPSAAVSEAAVNPRPPLSATVPEPKLPSAALSAVPSARVLPAPAAPRPPVPAARRSETRSKSVVLKKEIDIGY